MKLRRLLFAAFGTVTLFLGTLGIFVPILPTVPLYLLTLFMFANSSHRLHNWFVNTKLYKKHLLPYIKAGGLTKKAKIYLIIFVTVQILIAALLLRNSLIGVLICVAVYLGFILSMIFAVKTVIISKEKEKNYD